MDFSVLPVEGKEERSSNKKQVLLYVLYNIRLRSIEHRSEERGELTSFTRIFPSCVGSYHDGLGSAVCYQINN